MTDPNSEFPVKLHMRLLRNGTSIFSTTTSEPVEVGRRQAHEFGIFRVHLLHGGGGLCRDVPYQQENDEYDKRDREGSPVQRREHLASHDFC